MHKSSRKKINDQSDLIIDANIMILLQERNPDFLKKIFTEVNPYLTRICLGNGIDSDDVHELIHRTWERFFTNLEKFKGRSQIRTFICGILFNQIREHRRDKKKFVPEEDCEKFMNEAFTPDGWWKVDPKDPQKIMESKELSHFIKECIEGLTEQQMAAFVMKEVEDEDQENICNILGVNVSHLRVLLFRAKDKLRKCLEGKVFAEEV